MLTRVAAILILLLAHVAPSLGLASRAPAGPCADAPAAAPCCCGDRDICPCAVEDSPADAPSKAPIAPPASPRTSVGDLFPVLPALELPAWDAPLPEAPRPLAPRAERAAASASTIEALALLCVWRT